MAKHEHFRAKLYQRRARLEEMIAAMEKQGLGMPLSYSLGELSAYDNHPADLGSEVFERSKDAAVRDSLRLRLSEIDEALERLQDGTYGICERCAKPIEPERLSIIPETKLCSACARSDEPAGFFLEGRKRPIEEEVITFPFGNAPRDNVGYDGEDAWQDVARYGTSETPSDNPTDWSYPSYYDKDEDRGTVQEVEKIISEQDDRLGSTYNPQ